MNTWLNTLLPFGKSALVMGPPGASSPPTSFLPSYHQNPGYFQVLCPGLASARWIGMLFLCQNTRHFRGRKSLSVPTYLPFLGLSASHLPLLLPFSVLPCRNTHATLFCIFLTISAVTRSDTNQTYISVPHPLKLMISENSSQGYWAVCNFSFRNRVEWERRLQRSWASRDKVRPLWRELSYRSRPGNQRCFQSVQW